MEVSSPRDVSSFTLAELVDTLLDCNGSIVKAAEKLRVPRKQLCRVLRESGLRL